MIAILKYADRQRVQEAFIEGVSAYCANTIMRDHVQEEKALLLGGCESVCVPRGVKVKRSHCLTLLLLVGASKQGSFLRRHVDYIIDYI